MSKKQIHSKKKKTGTVCTACRLLMLAVYGYSVFFWGSVTLAALFRGSYDGSAEPPGWVGVSMGCGWLLLTAAMLLSFFKKDITAFLLAAGGTAAFCAAFRRYPTSSQRKMSQTTCWKWTGSMLGGISRRWRYPWRRSCLLSSRSFRCSAKGSKRLKRKAQSL